MTPVEADSQVHDPDLLTFTPTPPEILPVIQGSMERVVGKAFAAANQEGQEARTNRFGLSMSGLGACVRESAYRVAGTPPDEEYVAASGEDEARAAMIGTWVHAGLLPHVAALLWDAVAELRLRLVAPVGDPGAGTVWVVEGSTDTYTRAAGGGVLDLKTVGAYKLGTIEAEGAKQAHRRQVHGYAAAALQAGLPVSWVAWLYMDRGDGTVHVVVEPFGREEYVGVLRRVRYLHTLSAEPGDAPREERGPGLSWRCDVCPFLRRCWGPSAEPGNPGAIAVHDRADIEYAAAQVIALRKPYNELEKKIDFFKAQVGRPEAGQYGSATVTYGADGEKPDVPELIRLVTELGYEVPMVPRPGNTYIRQAPKSKGTD